MPPSAILTSIFTTQKLERHLQGHVAKKDWGARFLPMPSLGVRMFLDIHGDGADTTAVDAIARFVQKFKDQHWPAGSRLPEIYYDTRSFGGQSVMHSKCIVVDGEELFVSSANFTDAAQHRNVEMGLLVRSRSIAEQALRFFESLVRSGHCQRVV